MTESFIGIDIEPDALELLQTVLGPEIEKMLNQHLQQGWTIPVVDKASSA